jgi:hypothetical protein
MEEGKGSATSQRKGRSGTWCGAFTQGTHHRTAVTVGVCTRNSMHNANRTKKERGEADG